MFRYLGFRWDPEHQAQAEFAHRIEESIRDASGWEAAFSCPGLRVFTTGRRRGANGVYPLAPGRGVVLGRLFRRQDRPSGLRDITLSPREAEEVLKTDGRALVDRYWGRYVAIIQSSRRGPCLLRDPSGTLPCYSTSVEGVTVFFSWLEDLLAFTPSSPVPRVSWEAVAALMSLGHLGGHRTALEDVSQVLPGRLTPLADDGAGSTTTFWSAVANAKRPVEPEPAVAAARLKQAVTECVQAWASCYEAILLRLSGGIDSAILLGALSDSAASARITCLNYHSVGSDSDERRFARLAAGKAGVELIERERDATFPLDAIRAVSRTPTPVIYLGRLDASRIDAEVAAAHWTPAMFTGGGGDQLFFQRHCTWPAADYLSTHGLGRGFVRASLDAARLGRVSLWHSMRRALADQGRRTVGPDGIGRAFTLVRREALDDVHRLQRYIHPDLLCAGDLPIGKFHQVRDLIDPTGYYDPYLREAAPEIVNPLLSQPLIELCLALPTWLLTHGGGSRALARRAFAHELPREIASRQSKGGMEEHVATILRRNLPFARELLLDGRLVRNGLLERSKVAAALGGRLSGVGVYLNEIHHFLAIEAWLCAFEGSINR